MITQREISQFAYREQMSDRVIEKDYVLTWLLFGLAGSPLCEHLVFKGGTALKKIYFPDYRYSEDLDFTVIGEIEPETILSSVEETLRLLASGEGFQFEMPAQRIERRADSLTVYVSFVGPLQARLGSRDVKVDFTLTEKLIFPVVDKPVFSSYSDRIERSLPSYSLEEIIIEKLCAVIGRTEPRDVYDLHFLMERFEIDFQQIPRAFAEKAASKNVDPARLEKALERPGLPKMWETRLVHQVKELPPLGQVLRELRRKLKEHELI
ncbi:MAG: nucleotidyl transferase AbiEii/AbiGii toxin family protein [Coriobacteriia bacterium]|nr:nucleotidyl transferase AbiEii/AbiGii toxin family protein [Coriobacteriia bacterium]